MTKVHSHYDNLRVTRNAPPAVIKAAYRTLTAQYHPDISKEPDAGRIMAILNRSYAVLSDPEKRRAHDEWIARQEGTAFQAPPRPVADDESSNTRESVRPGPARAKPASKLPETIYFWPLVFRLLKEIPRAVWIAGFIILAIVFWPARQAVPETPSTSSGVSEESSRKVDALLGLEPAASPPATTIQSPAPAAPSTLSHAPNGEPWPGIAGYVSGYDVDASGGYSTLTIDNTSNDFDVYVKLVAADAPPGAALRHIYIPRRESFTMEGVVEGAYEVRYKNLSSGNVAKTDHFTLDEEHSSSGVRYSEVTFTLYTVQHGNTQMKSMPADQF